MTDTQQNDDDFLFDRNDEVNNNTTENSKDNAKNISTTELLRKILNESPMIGWDPEMAVIARRVATKYLDLSSVRSDVDNYITESIVNDPGMLDEDMLTIGKIDGHLLNIEVPPIKITIDLSKTIKTAMQQKKESIIRLLMKKNIDLYYHEPFIMTMAVVTEQDDLLRELIKRKVPIDTEEYRCVYQLAELGKLDLLKLIMKNYKFPSIEEIVYKICIQAVIKNQISILEYFFTEEAFDGAPDQMFTFLINSVRFGGHMDIVKFFIKNGVSIRLYNYQVVHEAIKCNRVEIIQYFCQIDDNVITLLTETQKIKYNLVKTIMMDQYIGIYNLCNLYYDDILENDTYFECNNKFHYYKEAAWKEWQKRKNNWTCPNCHSGVKRILYINKKPNHDH